MLADSCAVRIVNGCRSFKWGQWHSCASQNKDKRVAVSNSLLESVLGLGELVSFPAMLCCELRSVFLLDILEYLREQSTRAQQRGQLVCFRQGYENNYLLKPREGWMHMSSNVSERSIARKGKHPGKKYYHLWVTGKAKFCKACIQWDDWQYVCVCWISFCREGVSVPSLEINWFCLWRETSRGDRIGQVEKSEEL